MIMRRLLYSDFETIAEKYRANIFKNLKKNRPKDNLLDLKKRIPKKGFQKYIDYIDEIITNIDDVNKPEDFLVAKPLEVKTSWEKICSSIPLKPDDFFFKHPVLNPKLIDLKNTLWRGKRNKKPFYEAIVDALRYDYVRDSPNGFVSYFDDLKINACVYCNASYIVNTNVRSLPPKGKISLEVMGRYELDHYLPKSQFPFLCVSFYNLQPSCPFCNRWKSVKDSDFNLYTDDLNDLDPFEFIFSQKVMKNLSIDKRKKARNILLSCKDRKLKANHNNVFHIKDLYKAFDDEAEELLWLMNAQTHGYLANIKAILKKMLLPEQIVRLLYRFYADKDIHKRPLSKMRLDLAKQLKLY